MEAFKGGGVAEQEKEGTSNAVRLGIRSVGGGLVVWWQCFISMLRSDPVRGDCWAGRRMDEALGIMGVFLLDSNNPAIVYQRTTDKEGDHDLPVLCQSQQDY